MICANQPDLMTDPITKPMADLMTVSVTDQICDVKHSWNVFSFFKSQKYKIIQKNQCRECNEGKS